MYYIEIFRLEIFEGEGCDQLKGLKSTFNDDNERMLWRTKQCLGNSFILFDETVLICTIYAPYYMHVKWFMDYADLKYSRERFQVLTGWFMRSHLLP